MDSYPRQEWLQIQTIADLIQYYPMPPCLRYRQEPSPRGFLPLEFPSKLEWNFFLYNYVYLLMVEAGSWRSEDNL